MSVTDCQAPLSCAEESHSLLGDRRRNGLDIKEANVLSIALDETAARLDVLTHQHAEQLIRVRCVIERDLQQETCFRVHRRHPELRCRHLTQTLKALDAVVLTGIPLARGETCLD